MLIRFEPPDLLYTCCTRVNSTLGGSCQTQDLQPTFDKKDRSGICRLLQPPVFLSHIPRQHIDK
jgi:hypothetical protein